MTPDMTMDYRHHHLTSYPPCLLPPWVKEKNNNKEINGNINVNRKLISVVMEKVTSKY